VLWPFWLVSKLMTRLGLIVAAGVAGFAAGLYMQARAEQRTWAVVPADQGRELPGDDLIPVADLIETRTLRVEAPPEAVWPWLVQMGYGRGGWYSYDRLDTDQPSAETILEEHQELVEGDLVPTHPDGGFVVRAVEPGKTLVLYLDSEQLRAQAEAAAEAQATSGGLAEDVPAGMQAAGAVSEMAMPDFRGSWTFVLEPAPGGATRLIERMRLWSGSGGPAEQLGLPLFGLGAFLMTRKHMLGVRERAERHARAQEA
jgi:hypothetical protein